MIISKAVDVVMKPKLTTGFFPSWNLAMEWMGFQPYNTTVASCYFLKHPHGNNETPGTKTVSWLHNNCSITVRAQLSTRDEQCTWCEMLQSCTTRAIPFETSFHHEARTASRQNWQPRAWQPSPGYSGPPPAHVLQPGHHGPDPGQPPRFQPCGDAQ